jgi:hypothetical protein
MMRHMRSSAIRSAPAALVLALAACASDGTAERPTVPDRPVVERPEGTVPEGLAEVREALADQRAEARARQDAVLVQPNALGTHPTTTWFDSVLDTTADIVGLARYAYFWTW